MYVSIDDLKVIYLGRNIKRVKRDLTLEVYVVLLNLLMVFAMIALSVLLAVWATVTIAQAVTSPSVNSALVLTTLATLVLLTGSAFGYHFLTRHFRSTQAYFGAAMAGENRREFVTSKHFSYRVLEGLGLLKTDLHDNISWLLRSSSIAESDDLIRMASYDTYRDRWSNEQIESAKEAILMSLSETLVDTYPERDWDESFERLKARQFAVI